MQQILLVIQLLLATALIGVVLLQRSDSDGFGLGSGGGSNFLSGRTTANLMTRTTAILAALFIINSLILSIVASNQGKESIVDVVEKHGPAPAVATPAAATPVVPQVPLAGAAPEAKPEVKAEAPPVAKPQPKPAKKSAPNNEPAEDAESESENQE